MRKLGTRLVYFPVRPRFFVRRGREVLISYSHTYIHITCKVQTDPIGSVKNSTRRLVLRHSSLITLCSLDTGAGPLPPTEKLNLSAPAPQIFSRKCRHPVYPSCEGGHCGDVIIDEDLRGVTKAIGGGKSNDCAQDRTGGLLCTPAP